MAAHKRPGRRHRGRDAGRSRLGGTATAEVQSHSAGVLRAALKRVRWDLRLVTHQGMAIAHESRPGLRDFAGSRQEAPDDHEDERQPHAGAQYRGVNSSLQVW